MQHDAPEPASLVIVGAGPAGRAAAEILTDARIVARPEATAWHAEPGRLWTETEAGVEAVPFAGLLLCADEPLLLLALGCAFADGRPLVDDAGRTSVPGIHAAGRIVGAADASTAARQGREAALAFSRPASGAIAPPPSPEPAPLLDSLALAQLLERQPGPERNRAALAQAAARGPRLAQVPAPARPVGFAALAALAPSALPPRDPQHDAGALL